MAFSAAQKTILNDLIKYLPALKKQIAATDIQLGDSFGAYDRKLAAATDGIGAVQVARATFDVAVVGGAIATTFDLGVTIPAKAIIIDGIIDVITALDSAAHTATIAIQVESAGDMLADVVVSSGGTLGFHDIIPVGTAATVVKTTVARNIKLVTGNHASQTLTVGKLVVQLRYVVSA